MAQSKENSAPKDQNIWRYVKRSASIILHFVGGLSLFLGIVIYIAKLFVEPPSDSRLASSVRLFLIAVQDTNQIVVATMKAVEEVNIQYLRNEFSAAGMSKFTVSLDCAKNDNISGVCEIYTDINGNKISSDLEYSNIIKKTTETLGIINSYSNTLTKMLDAKGIEELQQLACDKFHASPDMNIALVNFGECVDNHKPKANLFYLLSYFREVNERYDFIEMKVKTVAPDFEILSNSLLLSMDSMKTIDKNIAITSLESLINQEVTNRQSRNFDHSRIFDALLNSMRQLRTLSASDSKIAISKMLEAHKVLLDILSSQDAKRQISRQDDLQKIVESLTALKENLDILKR